jgi:hypothetical protein
MSTESTTQRYVDAATTIWHVWALTLLFAATAAYGYVGTGDPALELMAGVLAVVCLGYAVTQTRARYERNRVMD